MESSGIGQSVKTWSKLHGRRLKQLRLDRGLTQRSLRLELNKHVELRTTDSVANWENARNHPREEYLPALSKVLLVSVEYLLASSVVKVPSFSSLGVSWYRALPLPGRMTLIVEPVLRGLREQGFEYFFPGEEFGVRQFWEELGAYLGRPLTDEFQQKSALSQWVRSTEKKRALVLAGFRGLESELDLQKCAADWDIYLKMIFSVRGYCHVVLIQPVDPLHCQIEANRGSLKELTPQLADIPMDVAPESFAERLFLELPFCCLETLRELLVPRHEKLNPLCMRKLVEAEVLCQNGEDLVLCHETWREPWTKRFLNQP